MAAQVVPASSAIDMVGPYLASRATCPVCSKVNTLLHMEGPASAVKAHDVCKHIKAHLVDDDGNSAYEFAE